MVKQSVHRPEKIDRHKDRGLVKHQTTHYLPDLDRSTDLPPMQLVTVECCRMWQLLLMMRQGGVTIHLCGICCWMDDTLIGYSLLQSCAPF